MSIISMYYTQNGGDVFQSGNQLLYQIYILSITGTLFLSKYKYGSNEGPVTYR